MENISDQTKQLELIDLFELNHKLLINLFDLNSKKISEMNNSLNWVTSILSAILIFFNTKLADTNICFNKWYLVFIGTLFISFISLFALYKYKLVLFIKKTSELIIQNQNRIYLAKGFAVYNKQDNDKMALEFANAFNEEFKDDNTDITNTNSTLNKAKRNDNNIRYMECIFKIAMAIFIIYILSIPIYYLL